MAAPGAEHFGLSVLSWGPLGAGVLSTRGTSRTTRFAKQGNASRGRTSGRGLAIARAVDAVADELGVTFTQVATAWVAAQSYQCIPLVGARKVEQIKDTLGATAATLDKDQLSRLDEASRIELGFPHDFLRSDGVRDVVRSRVRDRIDGRPARR